MDRNTHRSIPFSFNTEIVQLCDFFLEHSLCNTFSITGLQSFPGNISLSYMPTSFSWYPSKLKSWKQIGRLSPSTKAPNNFLIPELKIKRRIPGLQSTSLGFNKPTFITQLDSSTTGSFLSQLLCALTVDKNMTPPCTLNHGAAHMLSPVCWRQHRK